MATQQEYLDDLVRKTMVEDEGGTYIVRGPIALPVFFPMPFDPSASSPEQWRDRVLANFRDVYLAWWTNAFEALRAELAGQAFADKSTGNAGVEYNPDTGLFEERGTPP